jgi:hypothetical protein
MCFLSTNSRSRGGSGVWREIKYHVSGRFSNAAHDLDANLLSSSVSFDHILQCCRHILCETTVHRFITDRLSSWDLMGKKQGRFVRRQEPLEWVDMSGQ